MREHESSNLAKLKFILKDGFQTATYTAYGKVTTGGVTTTWVPLIDAAGSTIALVNAAQVNSLPPATTITYDPSGTPTVSGAPNSFPFLYQGLEHEITDPGNLYFNPSGNVYNPQFQRNMSQVGQQGLSGPGNGDFGPGRRAGRQGGMSPWQVLNDEAIVFEAPFIFTPGSEAIHPSIPLSIFESIINFFSGGGRSASAIPRQMEKHRHDIYQILEIADDLTTTQASKASKAPKASGGAPNKPLQKQSPAPPSACSQYDAECAQSGKNDSYACQAGDCCRYFGDSPSANCTRGCLLGHESSCFGSSSAVTCRREAHISCYSQCGQNPITWTGSGACWSLMWGLR
jgi:hypothetical protein